eukprot:ctg_1471.g499
MRRPQHLQTLNAEAAHAQTGNAKAELQDGSGGHGGGGIDAAGWRYGG